jgi:hypothetical protein
MTEKLFDALTQAIRGLEPAQPKHKKNSELAFICTQGKPENFLRDKIAYLVASRSNCSMKAIPEKGRVDLTIEDGGKPLLVEFKVGFAGGILRAGKDPEEGRTAFAIQSIQKDIDNPKKRAKDGTVFSIFILHFRSPDPNNNYKGFHYEKLMIEGDKENSLRTCKEYVDKRWPNGWNIEVLEVPFGSWAEISVTAQVFLLTAIRLN